MDKYFWLDVEMKENSNQSRIAIIETNISGGRFGIQNLKSFQVSKCHIGNNIPKVRNLVKMDWSTIYAEDNWNPYLKLNFTEVFPNLSGENLHMDTSMSLDSVMPFSIIKLENIENFRLDNSTFRLILTVRLLYLTKVNGNIQSADFQQLHFFSTGLYFKESNVNVSIINVSKSNGHGRGMIFATDVSKLALIDLNLISNKGIFDIFSLTKTSIWINRLNITYMELIRRIFLLMTPKRTTLTNLEFVSVRGGSSYLESNNWKEKVEVIIRNVSMIGSPSRFGFWCSRINLKMMNFNFTDTKIEREVFQVAGRSDVVLKDIRLHNCTSNFFLNAARFSTVNLTDIKLLKSTLTYSTVSMEKAFLRIRNFNNQFT